MPAKRKGILSNAGETVTSAAKSLVSAAEEYIVKPVGNAFTSAPKKTKTTKRPAKKKAARKAPRKTTNTAATRRPRKAPAARRAK